MARQINKMDKSLSVRRKNRIYIPPKFPPLRNQVGNQTIKGDKLQIRKEIDLGK
jgi:hypothetical protein